MDVFKRTFKRTIAVIMVAIMLVSAAPLDGFVGLDIGNPFAVTAGANGSIVSVEVPDMVFKEGTNGNLWTSEGENGAEMWFHYNETPQQITVNFADGTSRTYDEMMDFERDYGIEEWSCRSEQEQSYNDPWVKGETYDCTFTLYDVSCDYTVTIEETDIASVVAHDNTVIELTRGMMREDSVYNDETGEWEEFEYFRYEAPPLAVTVNYKNGTSETYEFPYYFRITEDTGMHTDYTNDQSYSNQWGVGVHKAQFTAGNFVCEYDFEVVECPYVSISTAPVTVEEKTNGYWDSDSYWDEELGQVIQNNYYYYALWNWGTEYILTTKDGETETYTFSEMGEEGVFGTYPEFITDQTPQTPWGVGTHKVALKFSTATGEFDYTITENPIKRIEASPVEVVEGVNCWTHTEPYWDEDLQEIIEVEWTYYEVPKPETITVYYKDGRVETLDRDDYEMDAGFFADQGYDNQWTIGNTYKAEIEYKNFRAEYDVAVIKNPIERIELEPLTFRENTNGELCTGYLDEGTDTWIETNYYRYYTAPLSLTVYYKDGREPETYDGAWEFQEATGFGYDYYDDQSPDNPWGAGIHTAYFKVGNIVAEYNVVITASPVVSITVEPIELYEYIDGWFNDDIYFDEETGEEIPFRYFFYDVSDEQLIYHVMLSDGETIIGNGDTIYEALGEYPDVIIPQGYHDRLSLGENTFKVKLMDKEGEGIINILENPIDRIEVEDITFAENTNGYIYEDEYYDEETDDYIYVDWFRYYTSPEKFVVYYKDGRESETFYDVWEFNDITGMYISFKDDQAHDNLWGVGEHTAYAVVGDVVAEYNVIITEDPIESIVMEPVAITEGTNGYMYDEYWDDDLGDWVECEGYYRYNISPGKVIVNYKDNTSHTYNSIWQLEMDLGWDCWFNDPQTHDNQWGVGIHEVEYHIGNYECILQVEITESSIDSIEIGTVYICEGANGWVNEGTYIDDETGEEIPYSYYHYELSNMDFDIRVNLKDESVVHTTLYEFWSYFGEWPDITTDQSYRNPWTEGKHTATLTALGVSVDFDVEFCDHEETEYYPEIPATCELNGYTAGTYCRECKTWLEGREWTNEIPHTDEDEDDYCDACNTWLTFDNFNNIYNRFVWLVDNCYEPGTIAPDALVYSYIEYTGETDKYYNEETERYTIPYVEYMQIVDKHFTNHSDMKDLFEERGYFTDETQETLSWGGGGFGGPTGMKLLSVYQDEENENKLYLQGIRFDYDYAEDAMQDGYDWFTHVTESMGMFGNLQVYENPAHITGAYELVVELTEDGVMIDGLTETDYYLLEGSLYEMIDDEPIVKYNNLYVECGNGATVVTEDGLFEDQLATFEHYDGTWYTPGSGFGFDVEIEESYELVSVTLSDDNGKTELEELSFGGYTIIPDGNAFLTIKTKKEGVEGSGDYEYKVENGEATITRYKGVGGDLVIPSTLGGYPVVALGYDAFRDCFGLTSVVIPDGVRTIGEGAFRFCFHLERVEIPASVTEICDAAFFDCNLLTGIYVDEANENYCNDENGILFNKDKTVIIKYPAALAYTSYTVPESVTTINGDAFYNCSNLTNVTLNEGVGAIREYAFWACDNLESITLPASLSEIEVGAFSVCSSLTDVYYSGTEADWAEVVIGEDNECLTEATIHFGSETGDEADYEYTVENGEATITRYKGNGGDVVIPSTLGGYPVVVIGDSAFRNCLYIKSVVIPNGIISINDCVFEGCAYLTNVEIPDSVTSIGDSAFSSCINLPSIKIPDGVIKIGDSAFAGCDRLADIIISDSVTTIGSLAFYDCNSLTSIEIPSSVISISSSAFDGCYSLISIEVDDNNQNYSSDEHGVLFNKDKTMLIRYPCGNSTTEYLIPDSVEIIDFGAFFRCYSLTNIEISDGVISIDGLAFSNCESLASVKIPNSLTNIGNGAFVGCTDLTDVYFVGVEEEWNNITIGANNVPLLNATIHFLGETHEHSYNSEITRQPTCMEEGIVTYTCSCGDSYTEAIAIVDHMLSEPEILHEPTCVQEGKTLRRCEFGCGYEIIEPIAPTGEHIRDEGTITEATCGMDGFIEYRCVNCGNMLEIEMLPATGEHESDEGTVIQQPTCYQDGIIVYCCLVCGEELEEEILATIGMHVFGDWVVTKAPTAYEDGEEQRTCKFCDETETRVIEREVVAVTGVLLDMTSISLTEGATATLTATVLPEEATNKNVSWTSSDDNVATVENGVITAINNGTAVITVTTEDGNKTASCVVTVTEVEFNETKPYIEVSSARARVGETVTVSVRFINNPGIAAFMLSFDYDESILRLENVELNPEISGLLEYGTHAVWYANSDSSFEGDFLTLTFTVLDGAAVGTTPVSVTYEVGDINNIDEEIVMFAVKGGAVEVYDHLSGDINGDGEVNNKDLNRLHKYLAGKDVEVKEEALDVNGDGRLNTADLLRLMKYLSGEDVEIF